MTSHLVFKAGPAAYRQIREQGFGPESIGALAGASGGAKWLVLSQLDRVVLDRLVSRINHPVYTLGSSIGAWRFACYAQSDPLAAIERFERAYLGQSYSERPDRAEITTTSRRILDDLLGPNGADDILTHPWLRSNIMTVRARHLAASESGALQGAALLLAMSANALHRRALGGFFERGLFYDDRNDPPWQDAAGFRMHRVRLTHDNLADAILASGSIPMVLAGVPNIAGAPAGMYRDGGVIDYHLDLPQSAGERVTLFMHFFDWLKPGWFDRRLPWRRVDPRNFDRTLLVCPSPAFIARLPGGKVPDRQDFLRYAHDERVEIWRGVVRQCEALAEELEGVLDRDELPSRVDRL